MADIHILSTMAVQRAMKLIEPGFTAFSGCTLRTEFASTAALRDRIQGGESRRPAPRHQYKGCVHQHLAEREVAFLFA